MKAGTRSSRKASKPSKATTAIPSGKRIHGLVLSKITSERKREQAAKLISKIQGSHLDEARKLTKRTIIPILNGVTREEAERHLETFQRSDISGRVTTRRSTDE